MVLPFISGTGEAVMCAIIFESELPLSWKTGSDITCNKVDNTVKVMEDPLLFWNVSKKCLNTLNSMEFITVKKKEKKKKEEEEEEELQQQLYCEPIYSWVN
jgi:hypothetical protein